MDWVKEYEEKREQKAIEQSMGNKDEYHRLMDSEWDNFYTIDDFLDELRNEVKRELEAKL
tara:strand:- start:4884 stop:5063 length:180 start_codon:yes stop_codon:yes gene_type:complete